MNIPTASLDALAQSAWNFHQREQERTEAANDARILEIARIVNARPDADDIWANLPIVDGEMAGTIDAAGIAEILRYLEGALEVGKL